MKVYIEKRKNAVLCNECHAFKGSPEKNIDLVYVIRVGNNTISFCDDCLLKLMRMIYTSYAFETDIADKAENE